jgi:hypothetical protein
LVSTPPRDAHASRYQKPAADHDHKVDDSDGALSSRFGRDVGMQVLFARSCARALVRSCPCADKMEDQPGVDSALAGCWLLARKK